MYNNAPAWAEWFSHWQLEHRQMRMDVGLVPRVLVQEELERGELIAVGQAIASQRFPSMPAAQCLHASIGRVP